MIPGGEPLIVGMFLVRLSGSLAKPASTGAVKGRLLRVAQQSGGLTEWFCVMEQQPGSLSSFCSANICKCIPQSLLLFNTVQVGLVRPETFT